jgi:hypothetical protein
MDEKEVAMFATLWIENSLGCGPECTVDPDCQACYNKIINKTY